MHGSLAAMSMALHILKDSYNMVEWWLVLYYKRTPSTHYYPESSELMTYMETHPKKLVLFKLKGPLDWNKAKVMNKWWTQGCLYIAFWPWLEEVWLQMAHFYPHLKFH